MRFKLFLVWFVLVLIAGVVYAFNNSLDGSQNNSGFKNDNNYSTRFQNAGKNNADKPFNPKEHTGFEHQNRQFPDATMNDTRYNSNCQFGTCLPGGLNPNNK